MELRACERRGENLKIGFLRRLCTMLGLISLLLPLSRSEGAISCMNLSQFFPAVGRGPQSIRTGARHVQGRKGVSMSSGGAVEVVTSWRRQLLGLRGGPGSFPPRCSSKCGVCTPCRAVHVPVPPGRAFIAEYYPEAWRCKCGNRLYLP